jgi:class 3 adenylate cyclase/predicted ATPase
MFCDMVGSSALSTRLDPEEQRDVVSAFQSFCATEIKDLGGMIAQYLGDGVLAYFGYPAAHEDDAERAVRAGLAILEAVGTLKPATNVTLQARIGIASGIVVVGDLVHEGVTQENAAIGETTNLAARLQSLAEPNTMLIAPETHRLVGALFEYRDLGSQTLKGFGEPLQVREVIRPSKIENRFEVRRAGMGSRLLGRDEELDLLWRRWEQAKRDEGRVVLLTGEPGIGKSRLTRALQERLRSEPYTQLLYHCSPYHQDSALYPIIGQLIRAAGIEQDDAPETKLDKLEVLLRQSSENPTEDMPLFAALLSIPGGERYPLPKVTPQRIKERTLGSLLAHLKQLAAHQPVLMVFEDLHWIDPTSLELLSLAIDQIKTMRILMLATARPEFAPPWPSHRHTSSMGLTRLDKIEGEALVAGMTGDKSLPRELLDQIVARTDGVPLFIEELTKTVLESGLLREADDRYELTGPLPSLAIPSTLHASLLARLDRLASVKDVAQIGAAIGREFTYTLISAVAALPERDLNAALAQLVRAELIFQRGVPPDATYQFKHALVQDTSYASLVRSRRQQLHGQIARALEERFPDSVATEPETLAHHFTEGGLTESALGYWLKAGQRAVERSADHEAIRHLERGLAILRTLPESADRDRRELDFQITLSTPLVAVRGYSNPEVGAACARATALSEKLDDAERLFASLYAQFSYCNTTGKTRKALEFAQRCQKLGIRRRDPVMQLLGHRATGTVFYQRGEFVLAREQFEQILALYDSERDWSLVARFISDPFAAASAYLALVLWTMGYPERAVKMQTQALSYAAELNHVNTSGHAHAFAGAKLELLCGNAAAVLSHTHALNALAMEHGVSTWLGLAKILEGWAVSWTSGPESGISLVQRGIAQLDVEHNTFDAGFWTSLLAEIHFRAGDAQSALALCNDARERAQRAEVYAWDAELFRNEGEVRRAAGNPLTDVEESFRRALDVSRKQSAKMFELRAATGLARLWHEQERHVEAHDLLAPVYGWFTEGFDTVDLKEAKVLLDQLNA